MMESVCRNIYVDLKMKNYINYFLVVLLYNFIHFNIAIAELKKINDMDILEKMRFCNK